MAMGSVLADAQNARVPYEFVYRIQQTQEHLSRDYTNLQVVVRMYSQLPTVKSSDLTAVIDSKAGKLPISLGSDGRFSVPMRQDLLEEKAFIELNQPKGTMTLDWNISVIGDALANETSYRTVMKSVKEFDPVQAEMVRTFSSAPRLLVKGMKMVFPDKGGSKVVIHAKSGDRILRTDEKNELTIPLEAALWEENPAVSLPVLPQKIDIDCQKTKS